MGETYMQTRKFQLEKDLPKLESYLRELYLENHNMASWLPERLHDLIYRMGAQETDGGRERSTDYIFLWEEDGKIVACILPDGDAVYISIQNSYEHLFEQILAYGEKNCLPLFEREEDGSVDFLVVSNDSLTYRRDILISLGYERQLEEDYDNYVHPLQTNISIDLPEGFRLLFGEEYEEEENKWSACNLGFHPSLESPDYRNGMNPYHSRKNSSMYPDSFECIVVDENACERNAVCAYSFVYVDEKSKTAFIEPVSTREKYRHKGIGTAMMHGVIQRCREKGIEKCYVNSYDWRRKFYNAAGFITEDSIGFWRKKIR
ncbi:MAG: GNAT family N-acetyltransferase [Ruminococcaceae bacterium]|nr:GNAT family N-acetyltransferase [Oscillospiraceae bacterium]